MATEPTPTAGTGTGATPAPGATPGTPPPADGAAPATGAAGAPPATGTTPPAGTEPATTEPADGALGETGQRLIADARKAERDALKRAKDAEAALAAKEAAELTEAQRKDKELADLRAAKDKWESERQQVYVTAAVTSLATKLNLIDVDAVTRLLDHSALNFGEDGRPTNTEDEVRALLRAKPYLAGPVRPQAPVSTGATEGTSAAPAPNLTAAELEAARSTGMSPERYAALKGVRTIEEWEATRRPSTPPGH